MPASIDTTNGVSSFVIAREDAWHALGTTLPDTFTAEDAMKEGHLGGWNVRKAPVFTEVNGQFLPVPGRNAVIRDNPVVKHQVDVLGDVGDSYTVVQNEEHAEFLNALVDESGAHFETAGALGNGSTVFITMKLPNTMRIGGVDDVDIYLAAINTHNGSKKFTVITTPIQVVCQNTLNMAFREATNSFGIRHTSGAPKAMAGEARRVLDLSFKYMDAFQSEAEQLINTTLTQQKFEAIIAAEYGAPEDAAKSTVTRAEKRLDEMASLFADAATQASKRNTAWAGLSALTEWYDHFSPVRGDTPGESRAVKALLAPQFKDRARELMLAV